MINKPKESMCKRCIHATRDCSHLDFKSMPVIYTLDDCIIVKCTGFKSVTTHKPTKEESTTNAT